MGREKGGEVRFTKCEYWDFNCEDEPRLFYLSEF